jgi:hypothetical protein
MRASCWAIDGCGSSWGIAVIAVCYGFGRYAYGLFVPELRAEVGLSFHGAPGMEEGCVRTVPHERRSECAVPTDSKGTQS